MSDYQNIFNRDFYPTPEEVIDQMVSMTDIAGKVILEPSFGSGNIVKYLNEHHAKEVIGCEINDKLRRAITGCTVIGADFLKLHSEDVIHIDMVVMNPPFSHQEDHILHAWEIAPGGCEIISLCNASMLNRGYSSTTKQKTIDSLINAHGYSENLGNVFSTSIERRTDCEIAMIRVVKPCTGNEDFDDCFTDEADDPEAQGNGIIQHNAIREAVQRYVAAISRFDAVMAASEEINNLTNAFDFDSIKFGAYQTGYNKDNNTAITKERFQKELQKRAWRWVFNKFKMEKYVTSSVLEAVNAAVEKQSHMPFTMKNVRRLIEMIVGTHAGRMEHVIIDAFDIICQFSDDNVTYCDEKWKTNSSHMVNKKFIVPYICNYDSRWPTNTVKVRYDGNSSKMTDVVKALCYLTGEPYEREEIGQDGKKYTVPKKTLHAFTYEQSLKWGEAYEWTFFRIKGHKKGTMHFEFNDEEVWYKFNQAVAKVRGWELPANVKVKKPKKKLHPAQ